MTLDGFQDGPMTLGRISRRLGALMAGLVLLSVAIMIHDHNRLTSVAQTSQVDSNFPIMEGGVGDGVTHGFKPEISRQLQGLEKTTKATSLLPKRNDDPISAQQQTTYNLEKRKLSQLPQQTTDEEERLVSGNIHKATRGNRRKRKEKAIKTTNESKAATKTTTNEDTSGQQSTRNAKQRQTSSSLELPSPSLLSQQLPPQTKENGGEIQNYQKMGGSDIVHIVQSKLLMFQPNLIALGKAQLELYRAICLKSLQRQTSRNFYHVLRTDPDLDPSLKGPLIELLQQSGVPHVLIAQNTPRLDLVFEHLRANVTKEQVWSGDFDDFTNYLNSSHQVIETWLDSDDGIGKSFVEQIQKHSKESFPFQRHTYKLYCASTSADWSINNMFDPEYDPKSPGIVFPKIENHCLSAGWSALFSAQDIESRPFSLFKENHFKVHRTNRACSGKRVIDCMERLHLPFNEYTVLRARTPTSMYLRNVGNQKSEQEEAKFQRVAAWQEQNIYWEKVQDEFGFAKNEGKMLFHYFVENVQHIARENLQACKAESLLPCPRNVKGKLRGIIRKFSS